MSQKVKGAKLSQPMRRVQLTRMSGDSFEARVPTDAMYTVGELKKLLSKSDRTRPPESLIVLWREEDFGADPSPSAGGATSASAGAVAASASTAQPSSFVSGLGSPSSTADSAEARWKHVARDGPADYDGSMSPAMLSSPGTSKAKARGAFTVSEFEKEEFEKKVNISDLDFEALALDDEEPLFHTTVDQKTLVGSEEARKQKQKQAEGQGQANINTSSTSTATSTKPNGTAEATTTTTTTSVNSKEVVVEGANACAKSACVTEAERAERLATLSAALLDGEQEHDGDDAKEQREQKVQSAKQKQYQYNDGIENENDVRA